MTNQTSLLNAAEALESYVNHEPVEMAAMAEAAIAVRDACKSHEALIGALKNAVDQLEAAVGGARINTKMVDMLLDRDLLKSLGVQP
jgi:hypothetical protein